MYDYDQSAPYTLSAPMPSGNLQFFSLVRDLDDLATTAISYGIPRVALVDAGPLIAADGSSRAIKMLSFGGAADSPAVVITGGIHAREYLAPEIAYLVAEYLICNYTPADAPLTRYERVIQNLVRNRRIVVLPLLNPNGQSYSIGSADEAVRMWRKNRRPLPSAAAQWRAALTAPGGDPNPPFTDVRTRNDGTGQICEVNVPQFDGQNRIPPNYPTYVSQRMDFGANGVDLNRNFGTAAYGYNCRSGNLGAVPSRDEYFGPRARSEVETQILEQVFNNLAATGGVGASIDYHSFAKVILYPTEAGYAGVDLAYSATGEILRQLISPAGNVPEYRLGRPKPLLTYDATGVITDRISEIAGSRAFTVELDPFVDLTVNHPYQFYLTSFEGQENAIQAVFEKNIRGALGLIAAAGVGRSDVPGLAAVRVRLAAREFLDWNVFGRGNQLPAA